MKPRRYINIFGSVVVAFTLTPVQANPLYWDTDGATLGAGNAGGSWDSGTNWSTDTIGGIETQAWVDGSSAIFSAGTDGTGTWTVNIANIIATPSITFRNNGQQTIAGGTINISPAGGLALTSSAVANGGGNTKVISSLISGSGGLTITSHGDTSATGGGSNTLGIRLANANNDFTGDITITSGLVSYTANSSFGDAANKIIMNGGGLIDNNQNIPLARDIEVQAGGGVIRTWGSVNTTLTGTLTGSGNLRRTDGGTLGLNMDASGFTGTLTNERGTIRLVTTDWAQTDVVQTDGGNMLQILTPGTTTIQSLTSDRDITIGPGARLDIANGQYLANSGSNADAFWVRGTEAGNNALTGALTSSSGTLTVTSGAETGNLSTLDRRLRVFIEDFDAETPLTLVKNNVSQLILDRPNTYTGGTTINGGRINVDHPSALGTGTVTVNNTGQAALFAGGTYTNDFVIHGNGAPEAAGELGAIRLGNITIAGGVEIASNARITADGANGTINGGLSGSGDLQINAPGRSGTVTINGDSSGYAGNLALNAGTLNLGSEIAGSIILAPNTNTNLLSGAAVGNVTLTDGNTQNRNLTIDAGATVNGDVTTDFFENALTLNLGGSITGDVLLDDNSTFGLRGGSIGGNLSCGFDSTSLIPWNYINAVSVAGDLEIFGEQLVTLTANPPVGEATTLINYGGEFFGDLEDFALTNSQNYREVTFTDTGSAITVATGTGFRTWVGNDETNPTLWDTSTPNWDGGDNRFFNGDAVLFDDSAIGTTVALQGLFAPESVTFNHSELDFNITGTGGHGFTGTTGITKNGTGNVTLAGWSHNYTGPVVINAGRLTAASNETLGLTSGLTINEGGSLNIDGFALGAGVRAYSATIAGAGADGSGAIINTRAAVFSNAGIRDLTLSADATVGGNQRFDLGLANGVGSGTINGNGHTLTKTGTNQITMRGPATDITYVVNQGLLVFEDVDTSSGDNPITVNEGAVLSWGPRTIINDVVLATGTTFGNNGGAAANWTGTITTTGAVGMQVASNFTLSGALAGDGTITRIGGNTLFLQNTGAEFTGKIVSTTGGTLRIASADALGTGTGPDILTIGGGTTLQGGTAAAQGSATIGSANQGITLNGNVNFGAGANNTLTINSPITGTGTMQKNNNAGDRVIFNQPVSSTLSNFTSLNGRTDFNAGITLTWDDQQAVLRAADGTSVNLAGTSSVRHLQIATGTVNILPDSTVSFSRLEMSAGSGTQSVVNQSGGTVNVTGNVNSGSGSSFGLGHWGGNSASTYNFSEGEINSFAAVMSLGWDSSNVNFNQSGGTANFLGINLANDRNNTAAYTMTGGRMNLGSTGITNASNKAVNLGGGTLGAFANWSSTKNLNLTGTNGSLTIDTLDSVDETTPRTITLTGPISGSGGIIKEGAGSLGLNNNSNSFTGAVIVNEGTLFLNGDSVATTTVFVNQGASLSAGTPIAPGTATVASSDLAGGDLAFRVGTSADALSFANLTVSGASTITITPSSALSAGQQYTLFTYSGEIGGLGTAGITLNPIANPHYSASLDFSQPGEVRLIVESADTLTWTGEVDTNWDVDNTPNWKTDSDGNASNFFDFDVVNFGDEGDNTDVVLNGTINPASVLINTSKDYSFAGSGISGTTGLSKAGTGTLTLLNNNSYVGTVSVTEGTLAVGNGGTNGVLGGTGNINVSTGASLEFNRSDAQTLNRTATGGGTVTNHGGNLTVSSGNHTVDFVINSGTLFARGGGWGTSFAANRSITINAPGVLDTTTHALGGLGGATRPGNITLNEDAVWKLNNEQQMPNVALTMTAAIVDGPGDIRGTGTFVTLAHESKSSVVNAPVNSGNGAVTFNVANGAVADDLVVNGNLFGNNAFNKSGDGTLVLTGNNTNGGNININAGVVRIVEGSGIFRGGFRGNTLTVGNGALIDLRNWGYQENTASLGGLRANTEGIVVDGGTIRMSNTTEASYGRGVTVNSGGITLDANGSALWRINITNDSNPWAFNGDASMRLTGNGTGGGRFDKVFSGAGSLTKDGTGTWTLAGTNTHTGGTTVNEGTLRLDGGGQSGTIRGTLNANPGTTIEVAGADVFGWGGGANALNVVNLDGATLVQTANRNETNTAIINMTGGALISATGGGSALFDMFGAAALNSSGDVQNLITSPIRLRKNDTQITVADGESEIDLVMSGIISRGGEGNGSIVKAGAGTLAFTAANTYNGTTTIAEGTLRIGAGGTTGTLGSGAVNNQATLAFNRSDDLTVSNAISGSGLVVQQGSGTLTLSAANTYRGDTVVDAGTLILASSGGLSFAPSANGTSNQITGSGDVELAGTFTIDLSAADLTDGNAWTLVDVTSLASATHDGSFSIDGFSKDGGIHTLVDGSLAWTYSEATGTLTLASVTGGSDYDDWADSFDLVGGPNDDDDGDGLSNFAEYAFGLDPSDGASVSPVTAPDRASGTFTYTRRRPDLTGLSFTYQYSTGLLNWSTFTPLAADVSDHGDPVETITVTIPAELLEESALFLRVEAAEED